MTDATFSSARLEKCARLSFFIAVFALPVVFIPLGGFVFALAKIALFTLLCVLALLCHVAAQAKKREVRFPKSLFLGLSLILPAVYAASALYSAHPRLSWFGQGIDTDTVFTTVLGFIALALAAFVIKERSHASRFCTVLFSALAAVAFAQVFIIASHALPFTLLPSTVTLVGAWHEFGVVMALTLLLSLAALQWGSFDTPIRYSLYLLSVVSALLLFLVSFNVLWACLFVIAAAAFVFEGVRRTFAGLMAGLALFSGLLFLYGDAVSISAARTLGIAEIAARPSLQSTYHVLKASYAETQTAPFFGSGPNTFREQWMKHKPAAINQLPFWHTMFGSGYGVMPTAFITVGILGGAWIIFFLSIVVLSVQTLRRAKEDSELYALAALSGAGAIFLMLVAFVYPLGTVSLMLSFILAGYLYALYRLGGRDHDAVFDLEQQGTHRFFGSLTLTASVLVAILLAFPMGRLMLAEAFYVRSVTQAQSGDEHAQVWAQRALAVHHSDRNLRLAAELGVADLARIVQGQATAETETRFANVLRPTLDYALEAVRVAPEEYGNWLFLGDLYAFLSQVGVQGAYENAKATYEEAVKRNPTDPSLLLQIARLEAVRGNYSAAREHISDALALKSNYTDAVIFAAQMEYSRGNMQGALAAARAAVATAPQNVNLWLELGLLLDTTGDTQGAIDAFKQVLSLEPQHANAKFFLGLAYAKAGKRDEAVALFSDLRRLNPDHADLPRILENLSAGRAPLQGLPTQNVLQAGAAPIEE